MNDKKTILYYTSFVTKAGYENKATIRFVQSPSAIDAWDAAVNASSLNQVPNEGAVKVYYTPRKNRVVPRIINPIMP